MLNTMTPTLKVVSLCCWAIVDSTCEMSQAAKVFISQARNVLLSIQRYNENSPNLFGQEPKRRKCNSILHVSLDSGTEIDLYIDWGDNSSSEHFVELFTDLAPAYNHTYANIGDYKITVTASNDLNSMNKTTYGAVDVRITNLNYSLEHAEVGQDLLDYISASTGSRISVFWDYGNGTVEDKYHEDSTMLPADLPHSFSYAETPAVYNMVVRISNSLDLFTFEVEAAVNTRIADLDVQIIHDTVDIYTVTFIQTITAGSHITCGRYFGDDILWLVQENSPALSINYTHTYESVGAFDFLLRCYNYLDYFIFIAEPVYVEIVIQGAYVNLTNATGLFHALGDDMTILFGFSNGTNISCSVFFDDEADDTFITNQMVDIGPSTGTYSRTSDRLDIGKHTVQINCSNHLSNHVFESVHVEVLEKIGNVTLTITPAYALPNQYVSFLVSITTGGYVTLTFDIDGSILNETTMESPSGPFNTSVQIAYPHTGYFTATVNATNRVSSQEATSFVGFEHRVSDAMELSVINVTMVTDEVQFTMVHLESSEPDANSTLADWDFQNIGSISVTEDMIIGFDVPYVRNYLPDAYGDFVACVNISNNVSLVTKCIPYRVGVPAEGFNCSSQDPPHEVGEEIMFICHTDQGSTVQYELDFGDGSTDTVNRTVTSWDLEDNSNIVHSYSEPGVFTVLFQAIGNSFVPLLEDITDITVLLRVGAVYLKCDKNHVALGDSVQCEVMVSEGSQVQSQINFGDGSITELSSHPQFDGSASGVQATHTFIENGNYSCFAVSENNLNSNNSVGIEVFGVTVTEIIVQESIVSASFSADSNPVLVPDGLVIFTVATETNNFPTDVFCTYIFPDGVTETVYTPQLMVDNSVEYSHTFPPNFVGTHKVAVNCSNLVSHAHSEIDVIFMQDIVNPTVEVVTKHVKEGDTAVFRLWCVRGSHLSYDINYQDGDTEVISPEGDAVLNGSIPVEVIHAYSVAYNYTVTVRVFNELSELQASASEQVVVQVDLASGSFILGSNGPVGFPPGDVTYTLETTDAGQAYGNLWLEWDFGDGSAQIPEEYVESITPDLSYQRQYQFVNINDGDASTQVNISNLVSYTIVDVVVTILARIAEVTLDTTESKRAFATGQNVMMNCSLVRGTQIQFRLQPGDGSDELISPNNVSEKSYVFTHAYTSPNSYTPLCSITNAVSSDSAETDFEIQHEVDMEDLNFSYDTYIKIMYSLMYAEFKLDISPGQKLPTAVQVMIDTGDNSTIHEEDIMAYPYKFMHIYNESSVGNVSVNITLRNLVSNRSKVLDLELQQELVGLIVEAPSAVGTGLPAYINISLDFGSHYSVFVRFGDGVESEITNILPVHLIHIVHNYSSPGVYLIEVSAHNDVMDDREATVQVITVQNEVPDIVINSDSNVPITNGPNFNLIVDKLNPNDMSPTNAKITISYDDSSDPVTYDISLDAAFEVEHTFVENRVYRIMVEVANQVNAKTLEHAVLVEEKITGLTVQVQDEDGKVYVDKDNVPMNETISFTASYSTGSNVSLEWKFNGSIIGTLETVEQNFGKPGLVQLELTARNGLGPEPPLVTSLNILGGIVFTYNTSILVGKSVSFLAQMIKPRNDVCFELQTNTSSLKLMNWFGPMKSLCEARHGFDVSKFQQLTEDTVYTISVLFNTSGSYSVLLTDITSYGTTTYHDRYPILTVLTHPCSSPSLTLFDADIGTIENPYFYRKAEEIHAPNSGYKLDLDCEVTESVEIMWRMFQIIDNVEYELDVYDNKYGPPQEYYDRLIFPEKTLPYGQYRFFVKVNMFGYPGIWAELEFYVAVNKSRLVTSIASSKRIGYDKDFLISAESTSDPDEKSDDQTGLSYEWFCGMVPSENGSCPNGVTSCDDCFTENCLKGMDRKDIANISIPETAPTPLSDEEIAAFSGCFGDGPGRLDLSTQANPSSFSFNTGHMIPNSEYRVVLHVTKDTRETWNTMDLEVMQGDPPSFTIECFKAVSGYSSFCREASNYVSAKEPYYFVVNCPSCPQDSTNYTAEVSTKAQVQELDVEGYEVLHIPADVLPLGDTITMQVTAQIPGTVSGQQSITFMTSGKPRKGTVTVVPKNGTELETQFNISHSGWEPYDSSTKLEFGYEACIVLTNDEEECSTILVPIQTTMVPGKEETGYKVRVRLIISDAYSYVMKSDPVELTVVKANDEDREDKIDSIDINSNPTGVLNSLLTLSAGIDVDIDAEKAAESEGSQVAKEEAQKQQASIAKMMDKVNSIVSQKEDKFPLSLEVKLQALTAMTSFTKKITKDIAADSQLQAMSFVESLSDTIDLANLDSSKLQHTADNMLQVLGSVGRTMEREVEVAMAVQVDPESIPDPEAEAKQREEDKKQLEVAKSNALKAAETIEKIASKLAKASQDNLVMNAPVTTFGNEQLQVTVQKATSSTVSKSTMEGPEFKVGMPIIPDTDDVLFMELIYMQANVLTFEESAAAITTGVQVVEAADEWGQPINMGISAENPFRMSHNISGGNANWANMSDTALDSLTHMRYFHVPVDLNNSAYISCLQADDATLYFKLYIKFNVAADSLLKPNQTEGEHDWTVLVPDSENRYCYMVPQERIFSPGFFVGIETLHLVEEAEEGVVLRRKRASGNETADVPEFKMNSVLSRCRAWDSVKEAWVGDKCQVGARSLPNVTECECMEISDSVKSFAGGVTIPKVNSINFKHVFSNFASLLAANPTVFATIISLLVVYGLLVIWLRHADKSDVKKWGVTPLVDNRGHHEYFYKVSFYTGLRKGAGTKSKVCFILSGDQGDTGIRIADDGKGQFYKRGSVRHFVMSSDSKIGEPTFLRIWHDNSGQSEFANWFLDKVVIEDLKTKKAHFFLCSRWLAADEDDGQVDRMIPVAGAEEIQGFNHLFFSKARKNMTDDHLWISLVSRPTKSSFTRVQRLTCCLSLLFTTMLANAMFFKTSGEQQADEENPDTRIHLGPIILSVNSILTSIFGSLVALPVNVIIVQLFRKSKPKHWRQDDEDELQQARNEVKTSKPLKSGTAEKQAGTENTEKKKKVRIWNQKYPLPRLGVYVAWGLSIISIAVGSFICILYSLEWGETKSLEWLSSLIFSFIQSVALIQPVKIVFLAAALSLLFKTLDDLDDEKESKEVNTKPQTDEQLDDPIITLQQMPIAYIPEPPSKKKLESAKKAREFEKKMWSIVKEMIYYFFFLLLISLIAWGTKDDIVYKMNEHIKEVINTGSIHGDEIRDGNALWDWLRNTAVPSIFYDEKYNAQPTTVRDRMFMSDMVSFRVGAVRLRQSRILPAMCGRPKAVEDLINECYVAYSFRTEEDRNYTTGWYLDVNNSQSNLQDDQMTTLEKSFKFFGMFDLKGLPYWGKMATYGGGGYVADLGTSSYEAKKLIDELREHSWIDHYTRAVFLEFTVYNPGINLFAFVNYLMEFPSAGAVNPSDRITSFQVYSVVAGMGGAVVAAQLVYCAVLIGFIVNEILKFRKERKAYWKNPWNWLEFSIIIGSIVAIAMFVLREKFGRIVMNNLKEDTTQFTNYGALSLYNENIDYLVGFLVFLANVKFLKLLRFNKHVSEFSSTIKYASKDLMYFAMTFFILFTAFAIWGHVIFGKELHTFSTFIYTLETMLSMLLGKFEFNNMEESYQYLGKIYFISFTIIVFFIVINMLLGIITMAYEEAREVPQDPMADYKVFGFLWKKVQRALHMKVKSEDHGEGYMSYTDTIDVRLAALDQHITHMYKDYLDSKKRQQCDTTKDTKVNPKEAHAKLSSKLKAILKMGKKPKQQEKQ